MGTHYRTTELFWAAGFMEGEGSFHCDKEKSLVRISTPQNVREPLERLLALFGGVIRLRAQTYKGQPRPIFVWDAVGTRAVGIMMTLYTLLSQKRREQVTLALSRWRSHRAHHRHWTVCKRGHPLSEDNTYVGGRGERRCRICVLVGARRRDNAARRDRGAAKRATVTEQQVREIRVKFAQGATQASLCLEYKIKAAAMHHLVHGLTWKHVT